MKQLFFIPILIIALSCNKQKEKFDGLNCSNNCYIIKGKVTDTTDNNALQGVELKFYFKPLGIFSFDSYLGRANTNFEGLYQFQFDGTNYKNSRGYYKIVATKSEYFYLPKQNNELATFHLDSSMFYTPITQSFSLYRHSEFILKIQSSSISKFESLTFIYNYGNNGFGFVFNGNKLIDTSIILESAADINTYIKWGTQYKGLNTYTFDTIICRKGKINEYQINL